MAGGRSLPVGPVGLAGPKLPRPEPPGGVWLWLSGLPCGHCGCVQSGLALAEVITGLEAFVGLIGIWPIVSGAP